MKRLMIIAVIFLSGFAFACNFSFEPTSVNGNLGDTAIIRVVVVKTHKNCSLSSMDEYHLEYDGVQLLGETAWKQLNSTTYEKYLKVSLAEVGNGSVKIWKKCTKEGYEEKVMKVTVASETELIRGLSENVLGFDTKLEYTTLNLEKIIFDSDITLASVKILGKEIPLDEKVTLKSGEYILVYEDAAKGIIAIVGKDSLYRFDQYILAKS